MTEDEARKKACPVSRDFGASQGSVTGCGSKKLNGKPLGLCIASDCMAWRWRGTGPMPGDRPNGFCGLSGADFSAYREDS